MWSVRFTYRVTWRYLVAALFLPGKSGTQKFVLSSPLRMRHTPLGSHTSQTTLGLCAHRQEKLQVPKLIPHLNHSITTSPATTRHFNDSKMPVRLRDCIFK